MYTELEKKCKKIREYIVEMLYHAKSGHLGGSLSSVEIITTLYHKYIDLHAQERPKFVLSKGHGAPTVYANLALYNIINPAELRTLRYNNSRLQGHPSIKTPGIDASTGSLGQGLSIAIGIALGNRLDKKDLYTYVLLGDGELQEGQIWEAALSAAHYKLDKLIAFVDHNKLQIDGEVKQVMNIAPIKDKFEAFGWHVQEIDGHNLKEIDEAIQKAQKTSDKPSVIIAHTIKGKGVKYAENQAKWHGMAPTYEEYKLAMRQLKNDN